MSFSVILRGLNGAMAAAAVSRQRSAGSPFLTTSARPAPLSSWLYSAHRLRMVSSRCRSYRGREARREIVLRMVSLVDIVPF